MSDLPPPPPPPPPSSSPILGLLLQFQFVHSFFVQLEMTNHQESDRCDKISLDPFKVRAKRWGRDSLSTIIVRIYATYSFTSAVLHCNGWIVVHPKSSHQQCVFAMLTCSISSLFIGLPQNGPSITPASLSLFCLVLCFVLSSSSSFNFLHILFLYLLCLLSLYISSHCTQTNKK